MTEGHNLCLPNAWLSAVKSYFRNKTKAQCSTGCSVKKEIEMTTCLQHRTAFFIIFRASNFEIEDRVKVPYKTQTLDDAGRERDEYVNYEGVITFLDEGNITFGF